MLIAQKNILVTFACRDESESDIEVIKEGGMLEKDIGYDMKCFNEAQVAARAKVTDGTTPTELEEDDPVFPGRDWSQKEKTWLQTYSQWNGLSLRVLLTVNLSQDQNTCGEEWCVSFDALLAPARWYWEGGHSFH